MKTKEVEKVHTTAISKWSGKPYLGYDIDYDFYYMIFNPKKNNKDLKKLMKVAKNKIQKERLFEKGYVPTILFEIRNNIGG